MTAAIKLRSDPAVVRLQLLLATRGFNPGPIDGIRGPKTNAAIVTALKAGGELSVSNDLPLTGWLRAQIGVHVEVPRVTTPLPSHDVRDALVTGHYEAFASYPSPARLRMARAQMGVEHGLDGHAVHTYNLGNVMTGKSYKGPWFRMRADEEIGGKRKPILSHWRASADPVEGAGRYWRMMQEHFGDALAVMGSTPETYAKALKNQRDAKGHPRPYYSAKLGDYARLMGACWERVG